MTLFRFRNDLLVISRPLHTSGTRRSTTLPIELVNNQRDMSVGGNNAKLNPYLERAKEKRRKKFVGNVRRKPSLHLSLDGCQHLRRDMLIFSVPFQTLTETCKVKKGHKITEMHKAIQMLAHVHQIPTLTTAEIPRTRKFPQDPKE